MKALVIFTSDNEHWAAGVLHRSCRHVFCAVQDPRVADVWQVLDLTIKNGLHVYGVGSTAMDLIYHYTGNGDEVFALTPSPDTRPKFPTVLNNCVGYTKALIGLRSWALTPYQLRNHLHKEAKRCNSILHFPASAEAAVARPHPRPLPYLRRPVA